MSPSTNLQNLVASFNILLVAKTTLWFSSMGNLIGLAPKAIRSPFTREAPLSSLYQLLQSDWWEISLPRVGERLGVPPREACVVFFYYFIFIFLIL